MKVDLSRLILDLENNPIKDGDKDLSLRTICCAALLTPGKEEQLVDDKLKCYKIAVKISDGGTDLSIDEIALLKKLIGKLYPPLVVGRCFEILDPEPKEVKSVA